jgi:hypothetical protein
VRHVQRATRHQQPRHRRLQTLLRQHLDGTVFLDAQDAWRRRLLGAGLGHEQVLALEDRGGGDAQVGDDSLDPIAVGELEILEVDLATGFLRGGQPRPRSTGEGDEAADPSERPSAVWAHFIRTRLRRSSP